MNHKCLLPSSLFLLPSSFYHHTSYALYFITLSVSFALYFIEIWYIFALSFVKNRLFFWSVLYYFVSLHSPFDYFFFNSINRFKCSALPVIGRADFFFSKHNYTLYSKHIFTLLQVYHSISWYSTDCGNHA